MSGVEVVNFGCRLNIAEGEAIRAAAEGSEGSENLVIFNSCAVTSEAERQVRQAIRRTKRDNPDARIIVTGCAAETSAERFAAMAEVDEILPNAAKRDPARFGAHFLPDTLALKPALSGSDHARAFVEVQNGCDHRCTFCIIPYGRGNSRSVPAGSVIEHIQKLVDSGFQEVVLTGVDVTSYGHDLPGQPNLGSLVERILKLVPDLPRLRLSSIDGVEIDARLFDLLTGETRVMPHIHLSLQAGDNMILKRMKRRHSRELAIDLVARLKAKRPDITIGADIIAGFPTEDDAMFANSVDLVRQCNIVHGHIFPYSPKKGTPAARMPQLPPQIIKARAKALRDAVATEKSAWMRALIGTTQNVAVESGGYAGHAENFAYLKLDTKMPEGRIVSARITHIQDEVLQAEVIE